MPFLMVHITSSNYIDKWVIWGKNFHFSQFSPKVFNSFDFRFLLIPPKWSFMIHNITAVSALQNDTQFRVSAPLQTVTINGVMWKPAIRNEYRRFLEKAHKRFYINRNWISKHVFYSNLMCSFVWSNCLYVRSIIFMFMGKIPYLIKKSHIRRFDSTISSIANLELLLHLNFYSWFLYWVTLERF